MKTKLRMLQLQKLGLGLKQEVLERAEVGAEAPLLPLLGALNGVAGKKPKA
tara:strand:+ start:89 stop:241 length:153 start_codon:yes stop_codon:yes gene_type:complete